MTTEPSKRLTLQDVRGMSDDQLLAIICKGLSDISFFLADQAHRDHHASNQEADLETNARNFTVLYDLYRERARGRTMRVS